MDPKKIMKNRRAEVRDTHTALFDGTGSLIKSTLDFCERRGYGKVSKLYAIQGAAEAALYGVAVAIEHQHMENAVRHDHVSYDSILFAALYMVMTADYVQGRPGRADEFPMEEAHAVFRKITGRGFRDVFIDSCRCENCKSRRKEHGIKLNPDPDGGWL
jgi:hypothetical protein